MSKLVTIGSKILVDFPGKSIKDIPAKVDTGAYTSSVWASNFHEHRGNLEFTLFAPESPYYTGQVISTKDYRITPIKNSFGHTELRYMVRLNVKIGKKIIKATFSLADRSANRYPVLIGRRSIKGKFLIDVTKNTIKDSYKILVLDFKSIGSVRRFFERIHEAHPKMVFTMATHNDLVFTIENGKTRVGLIDSAEDVADYDFVFIKSIMASKPTVVALAKYLDIRGTPYIDKANSFYPLNNKLVQAIEMGAHGIPVPKTILFSPEKIKDNYENITSFIGAPFILKDIAGSKGRDNFLIHNKKDFKKAVKKAVKRDLGMIAQEYIDNDGDYRVLVFDHRVRLVIHRQKSEKSHLNNTSAGGSAELVANSEIPAHIRDMSIKAANLLELGVAGVDMLQDKKHGAWYCLEVNHGPQITSGAFVHEKQEKFAEFLMETLKKGPQL